MLDPGSCRGNNKICRDLSIAGSGSPAQALTRFSYSRLVVFFMMARWAVQIPMLRRLAKSG
jgi:hypothetical protein